MKTMKERLEFILQEMNSSPFKMAKKLRCSPTYIYDLLSGKLKKPSIEFLVDLESLGYSMKWFATGKGIVHVDDVPNIAEISKDYENEIDKYKQLNNDLETRLQEANFTIKLLKKDAGYPVNFSSLSGGKAPVLKSLRSKKRRAPFTASLTV